MRREAGIISFKTAEASRAIGPEGVKNSTAIFELFAKPCYFAGGGLENSRSFRP
jgi:hypothetical protein